MVEFPAAAGLIRPSAATNGARQPVPILFPHAVHSLKKAARSSFPELLPTVHAYDAPDGSLHRLKTSRGRQTYAGGRDNVAANAQRWTMTSRRRRATVSPTEGWQGCDGNVMEVPGPLPRVGENDEASTRLGVMMRRPTLFLTVGLPCTGKTTAARRLELERKALRLTKDEWVKALYGHENPPSAQNVIEGRLIQIALRALDLGTSVVIDYGLWSRDERSALRQAAADLGALVEIHYLELTPAEQRKRLDQRQAEAPHTTWPMSDAELAEWAARIDIPTPGELDGSEPIDDPPARFATWDEWRSYRWPPSVS